MGRKVCVGDKMARARHIIQISQTVFTQMFCSPSTTAQINTFAHNPKMMILPRCGIKQVGENSIRIASYFFTPIGLINNRLLIDWQAQKHLPIDTKFDLPRQCTHTLAQFQIGLGPQ